MKKRLSLLMVLMMVLSLVPMSAFATAGTVPGGAISVDDTDVVTKTVTVKLEQAAGTTITTSAQAKLTLSKGDFVGTGTVKANKGAGLVNVGTIAPLAGFADVAYMTITDSSFVNVQLSDDVDFYATFDVKFDEESEGDITLSVEEVDGSNLDVAKAILIGTVEVAEEGDMKMSVSDSETKISDEGGKLSRVTISDMDEAGDNQNLNKLVLELPDYLTWKSTTTMTIGSAAVPSADVTIDGNKLTIVNVDNTKDLLIKPEVSVDRRDASKGDITLKVTGYNGSTKLETIDAVIGQIVDYEVTMTAVENGKKVIPALYGGETAKIKVTLSGVKGSFTNGRYIDFTVDGADVTTATFTNLTGVTAQPAKTSDEIADGIFDDGEFSLLVAGVDDEIEFVMEIDTDLNQDGAVTLTADSRDFGTLEVEIAEVTPAYTVEVAKITDIKKGEGLATADIVIKEAKAGMFDTDEYVVLNLNDVNRGGLAFGSNFEVKGTNGLKLDADLLDEKGVEKDELNTIAIEIESGSTKEAGTITVSNVLVSVSGSEVDGQKMLQTYLVEANSAKNAVLNTVDADEDAEYEVAYINVVKEYGAVATTTVFVIGSKTYTVNGVEMTANEAPYVAGKGYTMLPVRALAESLGLKADWNSNTKTATFSNDSKVASVTLGADTMYVNGTPIPLNAKAEIKNGSTFIELRSLASAFSVNLEWDAATKTVTVIG